jgi:hypothetical protein
MATNRAVPMLYPELRRKYGSDVTYWDNPVAHIRTEFGFDVLQVASGDTRRTGIEASSDFKYPETCWSARSRKRMASK